MVDAADYEALERDRTIGFAVREQRITELEAENNSIKAWATDEVGRLREEAATDQQAGYTRGRLDEEIAWKPRITELEAENKQAFDKGWDAAMDALHQEVKRRQYSKRKATAYEALDQVNKQLFNKADELEAENKRLRYERGWDKLAAHMEKHTLLLVDNHELKNRLEQAERQMSELAWGLMNAQELPSKRDNERFAKVFRLAEGLQEKK
jgi:hypothetical protein